MGVFFLFRFNWGLIQVSILVDIRLGAFGVEKGRVVWPHSTRLNWARKRTFLMFFLIVFLFFLLIFFFFFFFFFWWTMDRTIAVDAQKTKCCWNILEYLCSFAFCIKKAKNSNSTSNDATNKRNEQRTQRWKLATYIYPSKQDYTKK